MPPLYSPRRYDPNEDCWRPIAPMKSRRSGVAVGVLRGCLYACGGSGSQVTVHDSVERRAEGTAAPQEGSRQSMR